MDMRQEEKVLAITGGAVNQKNFSVLDSGMEICWSVCRRHGETIISLSYHAVIRHRRERIKFIIMDRGLDVDNTTTANFLKGCCEAHI